METFADSFKREFSHDNVRIRDLTGQLTCMQVSGRKAPGCVQALVIIPGCKAWSEHTNL